MKDSSKPIWIVLFAATAVLGIAGASNFFKAKPIIPWRANFQAATEEAKRDGKPIFAYFTASWCPPCRELKSTTWADVQVEAKLRQYVPVEIDVDVFPDLASTYRISAMPTFIVLDRDLQAGKRMEGALAPDEFIRWLDEK